MPNKKEQIRRQFLQENNKFLRHESVACIVVDEKVVTLGTVIREEDLLVKKPPVLCLHIPAKELERALRCLTSAKNVKLIQLNTAAFAYVPILKQLQEIKEISVEDEILRWKSGTLLRAPDYRLSPEMMRVLSQLMIDPSHDLCDALRLSSPIKLDQAQALCFLSGLRDKVSLIQGPPGMFFLRLFYILS